MKYARKKKNSLLIPILCLLTAVLIGLVGLVVWLESRKTPAPETETTLPTQVTETAEPTTEPTEVTEATEAPAEAPTEAPATEPTAPKDMIELDTPYGSLYFPGMWEDLLHINPVEGETYRMEFGCRFEDGDVHPLFDITFGTTDGVLLGTVAGAGNRQIPVSIRFWEPDEALEGENLNTFLAMQEDANRLMELLPLEEAQKPQTGADIQIQTPFCQLTYPGKWEQYLLVEHSGGKEYVVTFFARFDEETKISLFSLRFSTDTEGAMLVLTDPQGNSIGLGVEMEEISGDGLTQEQLDVAYAMQDALNDVLDTLAANQQSQD